MKKIKATNAYKPEVTLEQILAYKKDKPETHTCSGLVNAVCELLADKEVLANGKIADRLGLESKHLAFALEVLTGLNTSDIRAELIADRWRKYKNTHASGSEEEMAKALGFSDGSSLIKFMERNKHRFPELYLQEEEQYNQMAPIVEEIMPEVSNAVRRVFIRLPYQGSQSEKEACLRLLYRHGRHVADLALGIARRLPELFPHLELVESCALLHNVGIIHTNMPNLHCHGKKPYVCHGEEGLEILNRFRQFKIESLVAYHHLGSGIPMEEAMRKKLPLTSEPDMPVSRLICYASCFYSIFTPDRRREVEEIRQNLAQYGEDAVKRFDAIHRMFG